MISTCQHFCAVRRRRRSSLGFRSWGRGLHGGSLQAHAAPLLIPVCDPRNVMATIKVRRAILRWLAAEAERAPEQECCGLLAGKNGAITAISPAVNALASATAYEITPADLFRLMKEIRAAGIELARDLSFPSCGREHALPARRRARLLSRRRLFHTLGDTRHTASHPRVFRARWDCWRTPRAGILVGRQGKSLASSRDLATCSGGSREERSRSSAGIRPFDRSGPWDASSRLMRGPGDCRTVRSAVCHWRRSVASWHFPP